MAKNALNTKLAELSRAKGVTEVAKGESDAAANTERRLREELVQMIQNGESTGDLVVDHVLLRGYGKDAKQIARYRAINDALVGKTGQLIAVLYRERVRLRYSFVPNNDPEELVDRLKLGVLRGEALTYDKEHDRPVAALPVESFYCSKDQEVQNGKIFEALMQHSTFVLSEKQAREVHHAGRILAGDEAVFAFLKESFEGYGLKERRSEKISQKILNKLRYLVLKAE